jgi:hypothetical protein
MEELPYSAMKLCGIKVSQFRNLYHFKTTYFPK